MRLATDSTRLESDTWRVDLRSSVAAVLTGGGQVAGSGFLIAGNYVVTCAHVVASEAQPPTEPVRLQFPHLGPESVEARVDPELWRGKERDDVAFLTVEGVLPAGVRPLVLGAAEGAQGHQAVSFGFPANAPAAGHYGCARVGDEIRSDTDMPLVQLTECLEITEGFSGGPVLDRRSGLVIGMVDSVARPDRLGLIMTRASRHRRIHDESRPMRSDMYSCRPALFFDSESR